MLDHKDPVASIIPAMSLDSPLSIRLDLDKWVRVMFEQYAAVYAPLKAKKEK